MSPERVNARSVLFVSDDTYFTIWLLDPVDGSVLQGFVLPPEAMGMSLPRGQSGLGYFAGELYYTNSSTQRVWVLDAATGQLQRSFVKPRQEISSLCAGGGILYAASADERSTLLHMLDPVAGGVIDEFEYPGTVRGLGCGDDATSLFVQAGSFGIVEIDATTGEPLREIPQTEPVRGLAHDPTAETILVLVSGGVIHRINQNTGQLIDTFTVADGAGNLMLNAGGLTVGDLDDGAIEPPDGFEPDDRFHFKIQNKGIPAGDVRTVPLLITTPEPLGGFSMGFSHDPNVLNLLAISVEDTATDLLGAEFVNRKVGKNCGGLLVVFDLDPPFDGRALPAGENQVVGEALYTCVNSELQQSATTEIRFVDGLIDSSVGFENRVFTVDEEIAEPLLFNGSITCLPRSVGPGGPAFYCGGELGEDDLPKPVEGASGTVVDMCLYYSFEDPMGQLIQGLSMAIEFDCRLNCLPGSFDPTGGVLDVVMPDFLEFDCENNPNDGDGCEMVLGVLVDSLPPFEGGSLPASTTPMLLGCVEMEIGGGVQDGECLDVRFRDGVNGSGNVPIKNLFAFENRGVVAELFPCQVCVTRTGPTFFCGSDTLEENRLPGTPIGNPGEEVEVCFWYSSPGEDVFALTQSIRFDCRLECIPGSFQVDPGAGLTNADVQFLCDNNPNEGDGCEVVLRITPSGEVAPVLPATIAPRLIGCARFRVRANADEGRCLALEYMDRLNASVGELFSNEVVTASGPIPANTVDCQVCVPQTGLPGFFCGGAVLGPDDLPVPPAAILRGDEGRSEVCLWYTAPVDEFGFDDEIAGLSMAICFDCSASCIEDSFRLPEDGVLADLEPEFLEFQCDNDPNDGDGCEIIFAFLIDATPPFDGRFLPPTDIPKKLACFDMNVDSLVDVGGCVNVSFCDGINGTGIVPIKNLVSIKSQAIAPELHNCEICTKKLGPEFLCGGSELAPDGLPEIAGGGPGGTAELCFWYRNPEVPCPGAPPVQFHLQGFSMALVFDCRMMCLEDTLRIPEDSLLSVLGADFVSLDCDNDPTDGDGCEMIFAVLLDTLPPFDGAVLPPTDVPLKLACVDMKLPENSTCGDCFRVRFENKINGTGKIPTMNLVSIENESFMAKTVDCIVCIDEVEDPEFIRGDCNFDGEVVISDAAEVISFLFQEGTWKAQPPCVDACDFNDDGRIDLADAHAILSYLFQDGNPSPPPGPVTPGQDPTIDKLDCGDPECP